MVAPIAEEPVDGDSDPVTPVFEENEPTLVSEPSPEPAIVDTTIVEAFFSEESGDNDESAEPRESETGEQSEPADSRDDRPREDEIF